MINFGGQRNASLQVKEGRRNHNVSFYDFAIRFLIKISPPYDLYLNFEKSSGKNLVRRTGFLAFKNQFRNIFFADYKGSENRSSLQWTKNPVR